MEPNLSVGRSNRDSGQTKVIVNEEPRQSIEEGLSSLRWFMASHDDFIWEEFRVWASETGALQKAHHPNWWGALCMVARKRGMIVKTGAYRSMRSASSHARESPIYTASQ